MMFRHPYYLYILGGFLSGSIMYSYLLPLWIKKVNVLTQSDDGNPGTANAIRLAGIPLGMVCLALDMGKGFIPVYLAGRQPPPQAWLVALVMSAPVLGHAFSPWLGGRGGKAIAVTFGSLLGLLPGSSLVFILAIVYVLFSTVIRINPHRIRTLVTFAVFTALSLLTCPDPAQTLGAVIISATVCFRHMMPASESGARRSLLRRRAG